MLNFFAKRHLIGAVGRITGPLAPLFGVVWMLVRIQLLTLRIARPPRRCAARRG